MLSQILIGHVAVYVDDLIVVAEKEIAKDIMKELGRTFKMVEPEEVTLEKEVTFCGYQIKKTEEGYALEQGKYIEELAKKRNIQKKEVVHCNPITDEPDEENPSKEDVRMAQVLTGELGWVTSRTRPDIAYAVSVMSRMVHRKPRWVIDTGLHVMGYLLGTTHWGLSYTKIQEPQILNILVDSSYTDVLTCPKTGNRKRTSHSSCFVLLPIRTMYGIFTYINWVRFYGKCR